MARLTKEQRDERREIVRRDRKIAVMDLIPFSPEPFRSMREFMDGTGLNRIQVLAAMAAIREDFPKDPLVSSTFGYRWSLTADEVRDYKNAQARNAHTRMTRLWRGTLLPYVQATGTPEQVRDMTKQFERLIQDLADIIG